jgi:DNA-binding transcriptional MerR regulator
MPSTSALAGQVAPHGRLTAGEVGALVGVSGTTIGQWARRGYIRASQSAAVPHVYGAEDLGEALVVGDLLDRGVTRAALHALLARLGRREPWPLLRARLGTTGPGRPAIAMLEGEQWLVLGPRGWQAIADGVTVEELRPRLRVD